MKNNRFLLLLVLLALLISCQQTLEVSTENINAIFETKDFSISYSISDTQEVTMSFREDYMTYKSDQGTRRVELSYEDVLKINEFIAAQYKLHDAARALKPSITIYNDTKKVTLRVPPYLTDFQILQNDLPL